MVAAARVPVASTVKLRRRAVRLKNLGRRAVELRRRAVHLAAVLHRLRQREATVEHVAMGRC